MVAFTEKMWDEARAMAVLSHVSSEPLTTSRRPQVNVPSSPPTTSEAALTTKSKQAFILPDEFVDLVGDVKAAVKLEVVLQPRHEPRKVWDGGRASALGASRVLLADASAIDENALTEDNSPGRLGWIILDVPAIDGDKLFAIQIAARSDWFDRDSGVASDSKKALRRFDKVWRLIVPRLSFPVTARNVITKAEASYPSIGYSAGAASWVARGGKLRQRGVENIEFSIFEAPESGPSPGRRSTPHARPQQR